MLGFVAHPRVRRVELLHLARQVLALHATQHTVFHARIDRCAQPGCRVVLTDHAQGAQEGTPGGGTRLELLARRSCSRGRGALETLVLLLWVLARHGLREHLHDVDVAVDGRRAVHLATDEELGLAAGVE